MAHATCTTCGFDSSRWSDDDIERTLAHADDLLGFVLEGAADDARSEFRVVWSDHDDVESAHQVMHRLFEASVLRRDRETYSPMVGCVESLHASGGGVPKLPIARAEIGPGGVLGDVQNNRRNHGRPWQAVCLYSADVLEVLGDEGHPIVAGAAGENVTIADIDWSRMRGGLTIAIGDVRLRTSSPAAPCHKIGDCFVERDWMRIDHAERPGWARWYASVLIGGIITPGDTVTISA